jgi:drug/metabolite transporter (DMT)-like permease
MSPVIILELSDTMTVHQINLLATCITLVVLAVVITAQKKWGIVARYRFKDVLSMLLLGASGIFTFKTFYYLAFVLAPRSTGELNIINFIWPILVVLISPALLRERITLLKLLGALVSFSGVFLIISSGRTLRFEPALLPAYLSILAGSGCWGLFSVLTKKTGYEVITANFFFNLSALLCFFLLFVFTSSFTVPDAADWSILVLLGGVVTGLGYLLWIGALRLGDTAKISNCVFFIPFITLVYLWILYGQPITVVQVASLLLILGGSVIQNLKAFSHR